MTKLKGFLILISAVLSVLALTLFFSRALEATIYGKISGQVTKEATGEILAGVQVLLYKGSDFSELSNAFKETFTDDFGRYKFDMLKEGSYGLLFFASAESGYYLDTWADKKSLGKRIITIIKGQHLEVNRKALISGGFRAVIKKRDGTKVITEEGGINIRLHDQKGNDYRVPEDPQKPGEYYSKFPPGIFRCEAETWTSWGYPTQKVDNLSIEKGKTTVHEFILDPNDSSGIEGTVWDSAGNPSPDSRIELYNEKLNEIICTFFTDQDGHFSVVGLAPGIYEIWCEVNFRTPDIGP